MRVKMKKTATVGCSTPSRVDLGTGPTPPCTTVHARNRPVSIPWTTARAPRRANTRPAGRSQPGHSAWARLGQHSKDQGALMTTKAPQWRLRSTRPAGGPGGSAASVAAAHIRRHAPEVVADREGSALGTRLSARALFAEGGRRSGTLRTISGGRSAGSRPGKPLDTWQPGSAHPGADAAGAPPGMGPPPRKRVGGGRQARKTFLLKHSVCCDERGLKVASRFTLEDLGGLLPPHRADDTVTKAYRPRPASRSITCR